MNYISKFPVFSNALENPFISVAKNVTTIIDFMYAAFNLSLSSCTHSQLGYH